MTRMHYVASYMTTPTNPLSVHLIGAGGTGSQVLTALARMSQALIALGHPGLHVTLWDGDEVSPANLGRQLFAQSEVGLNKAHALINRVNRFMGSNWKSEPRMYGEASITNGNNQYTMDGMANLTITCVDTVKARREVAKILAKYGKSVHNHRDKPYYWLDFGNTRQSGQVILATVGKHKSGSSKKYKLVTELPFITDEYSEALDQADTTDTTPSCSLAEALSKQDLFINSTLAQMGCGLLWNLLRHGMTPNRGLFLNLADFRSMPLPV